MKKTLFTMMLVLTLVSNAYALFEVPGTTPTMLTTYGGTAFYYGVHEKGPGELGVDMSVRLEFAVYKGDQAAEVIEETGYGGDVTEYVYAYQLFCDEMTTESITQLSLFRKDGLTLGAGKDEIHQSQAPDGIEPKEPGGYFNALNTEAIWKFDDMTLVEDEHSWYLFLYKDQGPVLGDFKINPSGNDDIPMVPEPTSMALLIGGTILSLRRRK